MEKNICLRTLPVMALCKLARSSFSLACVTIASLPGGYFAPNLHKPIECALLLSFWRCFLLANYSSCKHLPHGGKLAVAESAGVDWLTGPIGFLPSRRHQDVCGAMRQKYRTKRSERSRRITVVTFGGERVLLY